MDNTEILEKKLEELVERLRIKEQKAIYLQKNIKINRKNKNSFLDASINYLIIAFEFKYISHDIEYVIKILKDLDMPELDIKYYNIQKNYFWYEYLRNLQAHYYYSRDLSHAIETLNESIPFMEVTINELEIYLLETNVNDLKNKLPVYKQHKHFDEINKWILLAEEALNNGKYTIAKNYFNQFLKYKDSCISEYEKILENNNEEINNLIKVKQNFISMEFNLIDSSIKALENHLTETENQLEYLILILIYRFELKNITSQGGLDNQDYDFNIFAKESNDYEINKILLGNKNHWKTFYTEFEIEKKEGLTYMKKNDLELFNKIEEELGIHKKSVNITNYGAQANIAVGGSVISIENSYNTNEAINSKLLELEKMIKENADILSEDKELLLDTLEGTKNASSDKIKTKMKTILTILDKTSVAITIGCFIKDYIFPLLN